MAAGEALPGLAQPRAVGVASPPTGAVRAAAILWRESGAGSCLTSASVFSGGATARRRRRHALRPCGCRSCPLLAAAGWRGEHVFFSRGWVGGRSQSPATAGAILGAAVTLRGSGLPLSGVWGGLCVGGSPQEWVTAGPDALIRNGGALALEMGLGDGVSFPGDADWYCWGSG